jgi:hypothetical protein
MIAICSEHNVSKHGKSAGHKSRIVADCKDIREKMNLPKRIFDVSTLLSLFHLDDPSANKLLNLVHNHWILHVLLCCAWILLKIRQYLFGRKVLEC